MGFAQGFKKVLAVLFLIVVAAIIVAIGSYDRDVRSKFEGKKWRLPSLVYGRPLELFEGRNIDLSYLKKELVESGYQQTYPVTVPGQFAVKKNKIIVFRRPFTFWDSEGGAKLIEFRWLEETITQLSVDRKPADLVRLEPMMIGGIYPHNFEDRKLLAFEQIPKSLLDALILTEDQGFYSHWGLSPTAIIRALVKNIKAGKYVQGASTITQQLVKNFYLSPERSLRRKVLEALYSVLLEIHFDKEEILETYVNEVYLGQHGNRAIHGFGLASEFYFNQPIGQLRADQLALLVAIVNGPTLFNPRTNPQGCRSRRDLVLNLMFDHGYLSASDLTTSLNRPIEVVEQPRYQAGRYSGYLDLVKRDLSRDYKQQDLKQQGLRIFTAFNPWSQWAGESAAKTVIRKLQKQDPELQVAVVVAGAEGDIEALIPGKTKGISGFNRVLDTKRSIGSLVKPAIVLSALESHQSINLSTLVDDSPVSVSLGDRKSWQPRNIDGRSHGQVPLYRALIHSYNQAMVRLGLNVGIDKVKNTLHLLGVNEEIPTNPAMLLGAFGLSPLSVLRMYQSLSSQGFTAEQRTVRYVSSSDRAINRAYPVTIHRRFDPKILHLVQYSLGLVMAEGTGKSAYNLLPKSLITAGKTGTSSQKRDSWFAGFTGDKTAVVWMGRDDFEPTTITGSSGALQVWAKLMNRISFSSHCLSKHRDIDYLWIDEGSGKLSQSYCQQVRELPFISGREPEGQAPCIKSLRPIVDWVKELIR